jgi:hypothetical protein
MRRVARLGAILAGCLLGAYAAASLFAVIVALNLSGASAEGVPLADFGSFYASGQPAGRDSIRMTCTR